MEKNIKEAISIIEDVRKSMPECTNKAFLKGALNELNEALRLYAVSGRSEHLVCEYCNEDDKPTCCDKCLESMVNAVQKVN